MIGIHHRGRASRPGRPPDDPETCWGHVSPASPTTIPVCGCGTHWRTLGEDFGKMGVHARLLDGFAVTVAGTCSIAGVPVEVRLLDNAGE